jgi:purine operon repressor
LVEDYISLARLAEMDPKTKQITVVPGSYFDDEDV